MATESNIKIGTHSFDVDYDKNAIIRVYLSGGGIDIMPIIKNEILLKIFDHIFKI
jgi:uncharacterized membrane protein YjgN (DUF898 family)